MAGNLGALCTIKMEEDRRQAATSLLDKFGEGITNIRTREEVTALRSFLQQCSSLQTDNLLNRAAASRCLSVATGFVHNKLTCAQKRYILSGITFPPFCIQDCLIKYISDKQLVAMNECDGWHQQNTSPQICHCKRCQNCQQKRRIYLYAAMLLHQEHQSMRVTDDIKQCQPLSWTTNQAWTLWEGKRVSSLSSGASVFLLYHQAVRQQRTWRWHSWVNGWSFGWIATSVHCESGKWHIWNRLEAVQHQVPRL